MWGAHASQVLLVGRQDRREQEVLCTPCRLEQRLINYLSVLVNRMQEPGNTILQSGIRDTFQPHTVFFRCSEFLPRAIQPSPGLLTARPRTVFYFFPPHVFLLTKLSVRHSVRGRVQV